MEKLVEFIQQSIIYIYTFLVGITLFSTIQLNQYIFGATGISVVTILGIIMIMTLIYKVEILHKVIRSFVDNYAFVVAVILFCLAIIWQFVLAMKAVPPIGFDVGVMFEAARSPEKFSDYFSSYPNNLLLLLIFGKINLLGMLTWENLALITAVLVSFSAIWNLFTVYFIDKNKVIT